MWKTLYDMFAGEPHQQELYHAIAAIGTLLLEIGEVGKKFYLQKEELSSSSTAGSLSLPGSLREGVPEVDSKLEELTANERIQKESIKNEDSEIVGDSNVTDDIAGKMAGMALNIDSKGDFSTQEDKSDLDPSEGSVASNAPPVVQRGERTVSTSSSKIDTDWSISFEQFLASMLTEPALVNYFESVIELREDVDKFRHRRLLMRQTSVVTETAKK